MLKMHQGIIIKGAAIPPNRKDASDPFPQFILYKYKAKLPAAQNIIAISRQQHILLPRKGHSSMLCANGISERIIDITKNLFPFDPKLNDIDTPSMNTM